MLWSNLIALAAAQSFVTYVNDDEPGYTAASDITNAVSECIDVLNSLEQSLAGLLVIGVDWLPHSLSDLSSQASYNSQWLRMSHTDQSLMDETAYMLVPLSTAVSNVLAALQERAKAHTDKLSINGIASTAETFMFAPGMIASVYSRSGFRDEIALDYANSIASDSVEACNLGLSPLATYYPFSLESGADITTGSYWESAASSVSAEQTASISGDSGSFSNSTSTDSSGITGFVTANGGSSSGSGETGNGVPSPTIDTVSAESTSESEPPSGSSDASSTAPMSSESSENSRQSTSGSTSESSSESSDSSSESLQSTAKSAYQSSSESQSSGSTSNSVSSAAPTSNGGTLARPLLYNALLVIL